MAAREAMASGIPEKKSPKSNEWVFVATCRPRYAKTKSSQRNAPTSKRRRKAIRASGETL